MWIRAAWVALALCANGIASSQSASIPGEGRDPERLRGQEFAFSLKRNIEYVRRGKWRLRLDLRTPDCPGPHPVAVVLHGGGWRFGAKGSPEAVILSEALAREGVARNAIGYRCVRLLIEAVASVPLDVRVEGRSAPDHPLAALLKRPNPEQTITELVEQCLGYFQVAGAGFLEAVVLEGRPRELYALRPDRLRAIPGRKGWPEGWEYRVGGRTVRLIRDASGWSPILQLKAFHPRDDYDGLSPLEAAQTAIDIHNSAAAWAKALIDNAARPSGALVYGQDGARMSDAQFERLKEELETAHTGPGAAGRPLLLEGGLDWKPMSLTPADMDFVDARNAAAREIALALGVPPLLLGLPGDNTHANYKEANLAFWRLSVAPLAEKFARSLTHWLGDRFETPAKVIPDFGATPGAPDMDGAARDHG